MKEPGRSYPLGPKISRHGVNFSVFSRAASGLFPVKSSLCQMSIPVAVPLVSCFAAPITRSPRPQPTSRTRSSPFHLIRFINRSRTRYLPIFASHIIHNPINCARPNQMIFVYRRDSLHNPSSSFTSLNLRPLVATVSPQDSSQREGASSPINPRIPTAKMSESTSLQK